MIFQKVIEKSRNRSYIYKETDQKYEILKVFEKSGNGSKNMRKPTQKKRGNHSTIINERRIQNIREFLIISELEGFS